MTDYNFTFTYVPTQTPQVPTSPTEIQGVQNIPTTPNETAKGRAIEAFGQGASKRAIGFVEQTALAPLNTATGGLATPTYGVVKSIASGAGTAAVGGAVVGALIAALQMAISKIQERIAKNEAKANEMNERDNLLIKAGAKTTPTFYTGDFSGVKSTDRR